MKITNTVALALINYAKANGGATCKNGKVVTYKRGYSVATTDNAYTNLQDAAAKVVEMNGTCGLWYDNGVMYVDNSRHINNRAEACRLGAENGQQSIYGWARAELVWLK